MKKLLSGNEAIARGVYEAGVKVAAAYPGTPSTEILENIVKYKIYSEWSPNEKVALEVATGASIAGIRTIAAMKHVGVNVAADPLFTLSYTGVNGGIVIITADDPQMHSSQNEQDNRNYAKFAKIPMLEPADSQEAKIFVRLAFEMSERFDTPVFLRTTTRISHSKSIVEFEEPVTVKSRGLEKKPSKYVMLPGFARARHPLVEKRIKDLEEFSDNFEYNTIEINNTECGIITSGANYQYAKEAFPEYSFLKLALIYPLPKNLIRTFAQKVKKIYICEELDPFFEDQIRSLGIDVTGKEIFPVCGEFSPEIVETAIKGAVPEKKISIPLANLPPRPPNMCPGCPHRGIFYILKKLKLFVTGDIGCYTLGALPPLNSMDTCICMGASIGHAMGISKAMDEKSESGTVAVIGDSTFLHSGITALLDIAYNRGNCTVIILDNRTTAMTGRQEHPGTGFTLMGETTSQTDYAALASVLGIKNVIKINPYSLSEIESKIKEEVSRPEPSVIISEAPCVLHRRAKKLSETKFSVDKEKCIGCKVCLQLGCPAIEWSCDESKAIINQPLCIGCSICAQVCKNEAITS